MKQAAGRRFHLLLPSPYTPPPPPTQHLHYINILSSILEFYVKELHREIDRQKQERNKKD